MARSPNTDHYTDSLFWRPVKKHESWRFWYSGSIICRSTFTNTIAKEKARFRNVWYEGVFTKRVFCKESLLYIISIQCFLLRDNKGNSNLNLVLETVTKRFFYDQILLHMISISFWRHKLLRRKSNSMTFINLWFPQYRSGGFNPASHGTSLLVWLQKPDSECLLHRMTESHHWTHNFRNQALHA